MILLIFLFAIPLALMGWKLCAIAGMADEQMSAMMKEMEDTDAG